MKAFFKKNNYFFLLLLIYLLAQVIVRPVGDFPLNDDWSYAKSVLKLYHEGKVEIGDWPAMTLVTHILWGFLFIKAFGFSFLVLRLSTWISTIICLWVLNKLVLRITDSKLTAFLCCVTMLFNPVFFNMTNTFMTDINFLTLLVLSLYFGYDFFLEKRTSSFVVVFILGLALVMLRQYGIIVPACMTLVCAFLPGKGRRYFVLSVILTIGIYLLFLWYESYLRRILPSYAAYKFSGMINPTRRLFWDYLWYGLKTRYKIVAIHAFIYTFPLTLVFLPAIFRHYKAWLLVLVSSFVFATIYYLYDGYPLQVGNVFLDTAVGTDTTYETLKGTYIDFPHFFSRAFEDFVTPLKYSFISLSLIGLIFRLVTVWKLKGRQIQLPLQIIFLFTVFLAYLVMILITESFFDRYQIPVICMSLLCFAYLYKHLQPAYGLAFLPLILFAYVSVFGTKDYFSLNEKRWEAYHDLMKIEKVPPERINGGFEVFSWNEGRFSIWYDFIILDRFDYIIQYKSEESFAFYKEYSFQRYFPIRRDTIRVFKRNPAPKEEDHKRE